MTTEDNDNTSNETPQPVEQHVDTSYREAAVTAPARTSPEVNLDTLLKVPVSLSIEVGRTRMTIRDLQETREGSVIELERLLDEPLDILVNGTLIAHGVVVLANERFGIQITDIISPHERAQTI